MQKYAVAIYNHYKGENEVKIVEAENEYEAILVAVEGSPNDIYFFENHIDLLLERYDSADLSVSRPVQITGD